MAATESRTRKKIQTPIELLNGSADEGWSKAIIPMPKIADPSAIIVLGELTLKEMLLDGGARLVARWTLVQTANKAVDHILESWIVGPAVTGLPRGQSGAGRGDYTFKYFDKGWW